MACLRLDTEFQEYITIIEQGKYALNKHSKIRLEQWVKRLKEKVALEVWKRNRNVYAFLLA